MRYVVASSSDSVVRECRNMLGSHPDIEIRMGSVPETGSDCDAVILNSPLAHERYGGSPLIGRVQILANRRDDGAPEAILVAAPISASSAVANPSDVEIENRVAEVLETCVSAFAARFSDADSKPRILVHLEGAGIDRPDIKVPLRGVLRFLNSAGGVGS
ncbi:hypothetical protein [Streptomyces sp. SID3212]|uniref:hypothetical protein n=1 Tax=Streptomyces sp. SID3212 TaxID=2690259 RepID=UPI00136E6889|nr:hypothetical protein [Streptomyces sp. SID3212]MYV51996.1 hypothetical protein [Streptomyces sp. SID3212]